MLRKFLTQSLNEYGMLIVLLLLCVYYSIATVRSGGTDGSSGGESCAKQAMAAAVPPQRVAIVLGNSADASAFAASAKRSLDSAGVKSVQIVQGDPPQIHDALKAIAAVVPDAVLTSLQDAPNVSRMLKAIPSLAPVNLITPRQSRWPIFLTTQNLLNIGDQISVIAIVAVGMTLVILTGGIDLAVGRLSALSAVTVSLLIRDYGGGLHASSLSMILCSIAAVGVCGLTGLLSGALIAYIQMPPFIVTLAMMQIASGQAKAWSGQQSIHDLPDSFTWLGKGASLLGLPNTIALMALMYIVAQVVLSSMRFGRHVYAVGGNAEAARLSGVNVNRTVVTVYVISGLMAGIGGLIFASELRTGSSTYGMGLELYVIAAVVLGGTSLTGGEGNVIGTIIGAFIIAVLHNGMDLTGASDPVQETVLGIVILAAVMQDRLRHKSWNLRGWFISPTKLQTGAQISGPIPAETVLEEETV